MTPEKVHPHPMTGMPCFHGFDSPRSVPPCRDCGCTCIGYQRRVDDLCWLHEARRRAEQEPRQLEMTL